MWTEKLPDGKIKFRERYTDYLTGKEKKVSVTMPKDTPKYRKEALRILTEKIDKSNQPKTTKEYTLSDVRTAFLLEKKTTCKSSTYKTTERMTKIVCDTIGNDVLVHRLTSSYVSSKIFEKCTKNSTINTYIRVFKSMMHFAYERDMVDNITWLSKLKKIQDDTRKEKLSIKYLESDELKKLLASVDNERYRYIFEVLVLSGMRIGELIALDLTDIDFNNHVIHIAKTYDIANETVSDSPKTQSSVRDIYIQPELEMSLKNLILSQKKFAIRYGIRPRMLVFNKNACRIAYCQLKSALSKYSEKAIGRKITPHVLRHTHVSMLAEQGIPMQVISQRLGHESSEITEKIYFHVTEKLKEKNNELIAKVNIL